MGTGTVQWHRQSPQCASKMVETVATVDARKWQKDLEMVAPNRWVFLFIHFLQRFSSWRTSDQRHDRADVSPDVKAWVESNRCLETIAHIEPQNMDGITAEERNLLPSLLTGTDLFKTTRGVLLVLPGLRMEWLLKQLPYHLLVVRIPCLMAKESGQPWHWQEYRNASSKPLLIGFTWSRVGRLTRHMRQSSHTKNRTYKNTPLFTQMNPPKQSQQRQQQSKDSRPPFAPLTSVEDR